MILVGAERAPAVPFGAAITMVFVPTCVVVTPVPGLATVSIDDGMVLMRVVRVRDVAVCNIRGNTYTYNKYIYKLKIKLLKAEYFLVAIPLNENCYKDKGLFIVSQNKIV